jgi:hypothetical protein
MADRERDHRDPHRIIVGYVDDPTSRSPSVYQSMENAGKLSDSTQFK